MGSLGTENTYSVPQETARIRPGGGKEALGGSNEVFENWEVRGGLS